MKINRGLILYWGLLAIALVAISAEQISGVIRLLFLLIVFIPFFLHKGTGRSFPAVLCLFAIIGNNSLNASLFPNNPLLYAALTILFVALFNRTQTAACYKPISRTIIIFLIVILLINLFYNETIVTSFWCFLSILLFISITNYSKETKDTMFLAIIVSSLALAILFLLNYKSFIYAFESYDETNREMWGVANACYYSCIMGFGVLCAGINIYVEGERNRIIRILDFCTIIICTLAMGLMASRGGLLSLSLGGLVLVFGSRKRIWIKIAVLLLVAGFIYFLYTNSVFEFLMYRLNEGDTTGSGRTDFWVRKLSAFYNEYDLIDWIFGVGFLNSCYMGFSKQAYMVAHNDFITSLLAYGIIGLLLFLRIFFRPFAVSLKNKTRVGVILSMTVFLAISSCSIQPYMEGYFAFFAYLFYMYVYALYPQEQR